MNRTEFNETLNQLYDDIENENGNFQSVFPTKGKELEEAKKQAAIALMAVDRYYSNLTLLRSQRKEM
ncbi:MAG: hypothetical protein K6D96_02765 [Acetatifactor sp.]|nr:hypothetical protein [Acetatifactor sp.]